MHAAVSKTVPPPSSIVPSLPSTFDEVVARAMARDPASRFGSVDELGEALLPFASRRVAARWRTEFGTPSENVPQASLPPTVDTAHERTPLARRALRIAAIAALMGIAAAAVIRFGRPNPAGSPPTPTAVAREEPRPHFEETAPSLPKPEVALAPASEPVPTSPPIASESSAAHVSRKKGANLGGHETARPQPPSKPVPIRTAPEEPAPAASHALPADDNRAPILDVP
jgi:serine/threonine-protein kinase